MTSNQEGVSCDSCRKNNFRGLRYKCLICYDYDLCSACYESGLTSSRHTVNHPMQCIIARNDYDLFYSGENVSTEQPQSLTCPLCGGLGFTESTLLEHVNNEHASSDSDESSGGVVCPICGMETNQLTYDFATHLTMEHRSPREPMEQTAIRGRGTRCHARGSGPRGRRSQSHYSAVGGPASSSPAVRESTDPLVEILAQLSGVHRGGRNSNQSSASQILQMQLHSSPSFTNRNVMRRTFQSMNNHVNTSSASTSTAMPIGGSSSYSGSHYCTGQPFIMMDQTSLGAVANGLSPAAAGGGNISGGIGGQPNGSQASTLTNHHHQPNESLSNQASASQYLLSRCMKPILTEAEQQQREILKADRSLFVQELLLQLGILEKSTIK